MSTAPELNDPIADRIAVESDRCVKCGLCLPACPTYGLFHHESDSPRGRISLMQGLVTNRLEPTPELLIHLDRCLGCRNCEQRCPSQVPYGRLIDDTRAWLRERATADSAGGSTPGGAHWQDRLLALLTRPAPGRWLFRLLRVYQWSGLQWLMRQSGLLDRSRWGRIDGLLPRLGRRFDTSGTAESARTGERGTVALFTGCLGRDLDAATLRAAQTILQRCGFSIQIPNDQVCCGALALHAGQRHEARHLAKTNLAAFGTEVRVIGSASACTAMLAEYAALTGHGLRVDDIARFVAEHGGLPPLTPLQSHIVIHTPCSQGLDQTAVAATRSLLGQIPGLRISELEGGQCCGAAGRYVLEQPILADRLREKQLDELSALGADILVSSNLGCALHLAAGLRRRHQTIEVCHPIVLLARQLPT